MPRLVDAMSASKPYHHGDLRRALLDAAERVLERDGAGALSLRAVAREAGVSAAAPYHHFKDKDDLLAAVARAGFEKMTDYMRKAALAAPDARARLNAIGVAYVCYARDNPAIYHLMYDKGRQRDMRAGPRTEENSAYNLVIQSMVDMGVDEPNPIDLELAQIAGWCAAHGLAEMAGAKEFDRLKAILGGDEAFFSAVLSHLGMYRQPPPK
jgi:AcrR family transcriptional regulator